MPKALTELTTDEVSLVTRGAVNRRFAVKKRDDSMDPIISAVLEQPADGEAAYLAELKKSGMSAKGLNAMQTVLRVMSAYRDEIPADIAKAAPKMAGYANDDAHDYSESGGKKNPKFGKTKKKDGDEPGGVRGSKDDDEDEDCPPNMKARKDSDGDDDGDEDEDQKFPPSKKKKGKTMKSADIPPELRAQWEQVTKAQLEAVEKAERLEKALAVERDVRLNKEFVEKAAKEFPTLGPPAEVGPVLKGLSEIPVELSQQVLKLLRSAAVKADQAVLFGQRGSDHSGGSGNGAWQKIDAAGRELLAKSADPQMTIEQARSLVMSRNPELYQEYRAEQQGGR